MTATSTGKQRAAPPSHPAEGLTAEQTRTVNRVIAVEEHAWTSALCHALLAWGGDETVNQWSSRGVFNDRLLDLGSDRLARMDSTGVDMQVLSITSPGTQPLPARLAIPLAREANDVLSAAVLAHPDRFAAFATLPTADPQAAAFELHRAVTDCGLVGAMLFPRTGETFLDHDRFRPIFEAAAELSVPLYIHPGAPPRKLVDISYGGFDVMTSLQLSTGGWGWHAEAGLATLRLILAGTFDRHPNLQVILGHWGELLVHFADRADVLSPPHLQRRVLDYILNNVVVTAGGVYSHRMLTATVNVVGPDRILFAADDPYGAAGTISSDSRAAFGGPGGARDYVISAPLSDIDCSKFAHLNAERILRLKSAGAEQDNTKGQ